MKRLRCFLLLLSMLFLFSACRTAASLPEAEEGAKAAQQQEAFDAFLDAFFLSEIQCDTLTLHYRLAYPEKYGIDRLRMPVSLGTFSASGIRAQTQAIEDVFAQLSAFDRGMLTGEQQIIWDSLVFSLEKNAILSETPYLSEPLGESCGLQAQLPILLAEYTLRDRTDIETYIALLNCVYEYFEQIIIFEEEKAAAGYFMPAAVAERVVAQCEAFIAQPEQNLLITCFDAKLSELEQLSEVEVACYRALNRVAVETSVIPAYRLLADKLSALSAYSKNQGGLCGLAGGQAYYETLLQQTTGTSMTVPEMKAVLETRLKESMETVTWVLLQDSQAGQRYAEFVYPVSDPEETVAYLIEAIQGAFPSLSSVNEELAAQITYEVKYVDESLQAYLSPAMFFVPPTDVFYDNTVYCNPAYDLSRFFTTIAHESFPGHLYQNAYFCLTEPHPVRSILNVTGWDEGWATYVEHLSYAYAGFDKTLCDYLAANGLSLHCLYSLTDIGIHYEGWSEADTVRFWAEYGISEASTREVYLAILGEPGLYLPYAIGCIEMLTLRECAEEMLAARFDEKAFHQTLLEIGPAPFDTVRAELKKRLAE